MMCTSFVTTHLTGTSDAEHCGFVPCVGSGSFQTVPSCHANRPSRRSKHISMRRPFLSTACVTNTRSCQTMGVELPRSVAAPSRRRFRFCSRWWAVLSRHTFRPRAGRATGASSPPSRSSRRSRQQSTRVSRAAATSCGSLRQGSGSGQCVLSNPLSEYTGQGAPVSSLRPSRSRRDGSSVRTKREAFDFLPPQMLRLAARWYNPSSGRANPAAESQNSSRTRRTSCGCPAGGFAVGTT